MSGDIFGAHNWSGRGGGSRVLAGGGQGGCETGHHAGRPQNRAGPSPNVSSADPETLAQLFQICPFTFTSEKRKVAACLLGS